MARRGGLALAVCAAALLLTGPAAQAAPQGLPGPRPGCPAQQGVVAPAAAPWAQQELGFASVWKRTRGAGVTVAVVDSGVDANPQFGDRVIPGPDLVAGTRRGIPPGTATVSPARRRPPAGLPPGYCSARPNRVTNHCRNSGP